MEHDKAYYIQKVMELTVREATGQPVTSPNTIVPMLKDFLAHYDVEHFVIVLLDTRSRIIDIVIMAKGSVNLTLVPVRECFREALMKNAVSMILAHNHPSGDPTPSREDIDVTQRFIEGSKVIGIDVLDHIVITRNHCVSLRENGLF